MANHKIILGDNSKQKEKADMILTDPVFELDGKVLADILSNYEADHLVLITSMRQLLSFVANSDWVFGFDWVMNSVVPDKAKSIRSANIIHNNCVYMRKKGVKSVFNRTLRMRSDCFKNNGYWPTILNAPADRLKEYHWAKNLNAVTDILGSFEAESVVDPFLGSGTTSMAAQTLGIDSIGVEILESAYTLSCNNIRFMGGKII